MSATLISPPTADSCGFGPPLSHDADTLLHNAGSINFLGQAFLTPENGRLTASLAAGPGALEIASEYKKLSAGGYQLINSVETVDFDGDALTRGTSPRLAAIGRASFTIISEAITAGKKITGEPRADITELQYNDHSLHNVAMEALFDGEHLDITASSDNPELDFNIEASTTLPFTGLLARADLRRIDLSAVPGMKLPVSHLASLSADAAIEGSTAEELTGHIEINGLSFTGATARDGRQRLGRTHSETDVGHSGRDTERTFHPAIGHYPLQRDGCHYSAGSDA